MPLHPEARAVIDATDAQGGLLPLDGTSPAEMRAAFAKSWQPSPHPEPVDKVEDRTIPGPAGDIPVRVYTPHGDGPFPALVWFHGGGWVIGSLDENDSTCRVLCNAVGMVVVSVDYRLAPEHRYPAAAEDAYAALLWVADHGALIGVDDRIAVGGESAGGNLAAVVSLMARDHDGPPLSLQLLAAPVTAPPGDRPSYVDYGEGHFLDRESMEWFFTQYPRDPSDLDDPYLAPLAASHLGGLPSALVMTAEFDPLRDEGEEYAHRLLDAGVPVTLVRYEGQIHGFFALLVDQLSISATAHARAAAALRAAFAQEAVR
ncbi:alpha/beta hydrolase [Actinosynnema sp. NPDC047251]|uniref:Alpha/beta hydrolase fold containing protein n=1 Tax=Saccharothrix espanaensis (strain ATCC 51144 / DSM 44229 / JCM 9112 / NBRC 15066 / NRRL 15764) TaxID=1179773 RepID=K0K2F5_SACES|nr:alpha/beta hydrolase [Saccharothrix espanaensis]CCH30733.1 alpha/beta hydrolase fold containing protein [Saccharothrix espanaensis DSM 44229]